VRANLRESGLDVAEVSKILLTQKSTTSQTSKELWHLIGHKENKEYKKGLRLLPSFDTCLIGNNDTCNRLISGNVFIVKTQPKWITTLGYYNVNKATGEIEGRGTYETNDFKKANARKIKGLDSFSSHYQPLYRQGKVSLMFHTLTRANKSRLTIRRMLHLTRKRYKSIGYNITGYVWTAEVSERLHWHYHLVVALDRRMTLKKIPKELYLEDLWGQRTQVEFVKNNVRHYMAKYFAKSNARVIGSRSYGISRKFV
jgi:hypothetical protein